MPASVIRKLSPRATVIYVLLTLVMVVFPLAFLYWVGDTQKPKPPPDPQKQGVTVQGAMTIVTPKLGEKLKSGTVHVTLTLKTDFKLAQLADVPRNPAKDLAHLHVIFDGGKYDDPQHSSSTLFTQERSTHLYSSAVEPEITYHDIPKGHHTIRIELVHNDHVPPSGIAGATVEFDVE